MPQGEKVGTITDKTQVSFTDNTVKDNTQYYYKVYVKNTLGLYSSANEVSVQTPNAPPEPGTLSITANTIDGVALQWTQTPDTHDFKRVEVRRSTSSNVSNTDTLILSTTNPAGLSILDASVVNNTTYYYKVFYYDTEEAYSESNEVTVLTYNTAPGIGFSISASNVQEHQCTIEWTPTSIHDFYKYELYRSKDISMSNKVKVFETTTQSANSYTDVEIFDNFDYYYQMRIIDQVEGTPALHTDYNILNVTTLNDDAPEITLDPIVTFDQKSATLSWSKAQEYDDSTQTYVDLHDFSTYDIYRSRTANVTTSDTLVTRISDIDTLQYIDDNSGNDLLDNETYYYRVFVSDSTGLVNTGSNEESVLTTNLQPQPVTLSGTPQLDGHSVELSWTVAKNIHGENLHDFQKYEIYQSENSDMSGSTLIKTITDVTTNSFTATNLKDNTDYYFEVKVVDTLNVSST